MIGFSNLVIRVRFFTLISYLHQLELNAAAGSNRMTKTPVFSAC